MAKQGITDIKFIDAGFEAILASDGCRQVVETATQEICDKANANNDRGGEFTSSVSYVNQYKHSRWVGRVTATDKNTMIAESEDKALTRAVT